MPDFDTRTPQEPSEPDGVRIQGVASNLRDLSSVSRLRNLLVASRPRAFLIGGGILLFIVVAVSMLAGRYYYGSLDQSPSPSLKAREPDGSIPTHPTERTALSVMPTQPCQGIDPDGIRNGKIAFDLHDEAAPVVQDPEGGIAAPDVWTVNPNGSDPINLTTSSRYFDEAPELSTGLAGALTLVIRLVTLWFATFLGLAGLLLLRRALGDPLEADRGG